MSWNHSPFDWTSNSRRHECLKHASNWLPHAGNQMPTKSELSWLRLAATWKMPPSGAAKVPLSGYELMNRRQCGRPAVVLNQSRCLLKWYKALKGKLSYVYTLRWRRSGIKLWRRGGIWVALKDVLLTSEINPDVGTSKKPGSARQQVSEWAVSNDFGLLPIVWEANFI